MFDDPNLVSAARLVPLLQLAEQAGLSELLDEDMVFNRERIRSGAANPVPKLTSRPAPLSALAASPALKYPLEQRIRPQHPTIRCVTYPTIRPEARTRKQEWNSWTDQQTNHAHISEPARQTPTKINTDAIH